MALADRNPWQFEPGQACFHRFRRRQAFGIAGVEIDDELKARVRRECPPPYEIDFRMSAEGDDKYVPPQAAGG